MNVKELLFGGNVSTGSSGDVYRDSIQAWLPVKNIIGGVVITKDNRFIKILEVLPPEHNLCICKLSQDSAGQYAV